MPEGPVGAPVIRVLIADQIARIVHDLEGLAAFTDEVDVCGIVRDPIDVVAEARVRQPDVLVLHEDFGELTAEDVIAELNTALPGVRVVLITGPKDRAPGAEGKTPAAAVTVPESAGGEDLMAAIRRAMAPEATATADSATLDMAPIPEGEPPEPEPMLELQPRRPRRGPRTRGEVFLVFSGKGGVGKTMVATNLAVALSVNTKSRVALVDLDLQHGDVGVMMHVEHHLMSIEDLAEQGEQIDSDFLEEVMATGPDGVRVLLAPSSPEFAGLVTTANLRAILREVGASHDYIVVDTPAHLEERTLEVIENADQILLVTAFNVTTVKSTKLTLKLLQSLGIERERILIVLNQTQPAVAYTRQEVEEILRFRAVTQLPYEPQVDDSIDNGRPLATSDARTELGGRFQSLVEYLTQTNGDAAAAAQREQASKGTRTNRRRFSLGRRR